MQRVLVGHGGCRRVAVVLLAALLWAVATTVAPSVARAQDQVPGPPGSTPSVPAMPPGGGGGGGGVVPAHPGIDVPAPPMDAPPQGPSPPEAGAAPEGTAPPDAEAAPDGAEGAPVEPPPLVPDPSPRIRVLLASFVLQGAEEVLAAELASLDAAAAAHAAAVSAEAVAVEQLAEVHRRHHGERSRMQDLAVASFVRVGAVPVHGIDLGSCHRRLGAQLTTSVIEAQAVRVRTASGWIAVADDALDVQRRAVAERAQVVEVHQARVDDATLARDEARAELQRARAADVEVLFEPGVEAAWSLTIMGESTFTADELAAFAVERSAGRSRAAVGVGDLARLFVEEGATEGMRADVAFAQAVLETGWFTNDDTVRFHNYAGIGHCDTCPTGFAFSSPRDGVRAQFQLLKSYVDRQPTYQHPLVDRRLRGPAGCCQTWNALTGVWATGSTYGPVVLGIYLEMLEWLAAHRAAA